MGMKTTSLLIGLLGLATVAWGAPRHRGYERIGPRVIIFEDANYRGGHLVLYPGDRISDLHHARFNNGKIINDQISSVRVEGGASIMLFDHHDFRGQVMRAGSNVRNLAHRDMPDMAVAWNDRITSLAVKGERRPVARPRASADPMIKNAYREVLRRPADPDGLDYYRGLVVDQGWTDRMVRKHLRQSKEYRHEVVDRMITQAYRDVLGRDSDRKGRANYRQQIITRNLTERQLRDALRNSREYRNRRMAKGR